VSDLLLRLCFRTYPGTVRERDGRAILDLARDLSSQSRLAFLREAGGMIVGGIQARGRLLRLDATGAPWHAARERLALPLSAGMLCVVVAFLIAAREPNLARLTGWWALLALVAAVGAAVGAALGRRYLMITASFVLLVLLAVDALALLANNNREQWSVNIGPGGSVGNVGVFAMWLPVALLLLVCAGAVGAGGARRSNKAKAWIACPPVVVAALVAARWPALLGAVLIYAPLALVAGTALWGAIRKNPVARTEATLLLAASCFPVLWLLAFVIPYPSALEPWFPLLYFGCGALLACVAGRFLLRDRDRIPAQVGEN
jgi:hypothetical protein